MTQRSSWPVRVLSAVLALFTGNGKPRGKPLRAGPPHSWSVSVVGESFYQPAVRRCRARETVSLFHEIGNPHDRRAIVVVSARNEVVGHLARGSWIHEAVFAERQAVRATIQSVGPSGVGLWGIVLDARLVKGPIGTRPFSAA